MRILGVDPGFGTIGFGVIDVLGYNNYDYVAHGVIKTEPNDKFGHRLFEIATDFSLLLKKYKPEFIVIEQLLFAKNITTAMKVAQSKGVILGEIAKYKIKNGSDDVDPVSLSPLQIKLALTSDGRASKTAVKHMVKIFLKLDKLTGADDGVDGLAIALAGVNFCGSKSV